MNNNFILLSHFLSNCTPTYGDRDKLSIISSSSISEGATANSFSLHFSTNHIGTHIDLPYHFYKNGKRIIDIETSNWYYNKVELIDLPCSKGLIIQTKDLLPFKIDKNIEMLIIRTGFEKYRGTEIYWKNNPGISPEVADYLRDNFPNIRTIGFDFISLTSFENRSLGKEAHKAFLNESRNYISVIEDMKLAKCEGKIKEIIVSPLLVEKIDSSPVTVFGKTIE